MSAHILLEPYAGVDPGSPMTGQMSQRLDVSRPAIVLDGAARGDLGVVRSLGLGGIPVHLLSHRRSAVLRSRFVSRVHEFPPKESADQIRVQQLRAIAEKLWERPVIFATGDTALRFLSRTRSEWSDLIDHDLAPAEVVDTCVDKATFAVAAQRLGLPVPETVVPVDAADVVRRAPDLPYPIFVKPVAREAWAGLPPRTVRGIRGHRVASAKELIELCTRLEELGALHVVLQRFIASPDTEHVSVHTYVDRGGRMVGAFSGTKVRVFPPSAGLGTLVTSQRTLAAIEIAEDVLSKLGCTGFASVQFKRDVQQGEYRLLEVGCRYSTFGELTARCGCNFPVTAYATMTGQEPPPLRQMEGSSWLDLSRDLRAFRTYRRTADWSWPGYLRSLASVRSWAFFAFDDPGPFLYELLHRDTG